MDLDRLQQALAERDQPAYRVRQVWEWAARGATGYEAMTNLPAALRDELAAAVPFSSLALADEAHARDGTVKALFRTTDGHPVEAVLMRYRDGRRSVCVSSQSGCPLTCTFCATGAMRFGRNLNASEILDQVLHFRRTEAVNHLVFMGMGEPMLNLDHVLDAARRLPDVGITHRRTTISTVGWLPGLTRFVDEVVEPIRLAFSIHAANPLLRSQIMPVNDRYPLADVLAECRRYFELRRRKVFVEYVMLERRQRRSRAGARAGGAARPRCLQGEPDPLQPDRDCTTARRASADRGVQGRARRGETAVDGAAHPRPRHRRGLRTTRGNALGLPLSFTRAATYKRLDPLEDTPPSISSRRAENGPRPGSRHRLDRAG